jgi:hypothetical protein
LLKLPSYHGNPFDGSAVLQADKYTDMARLVGAFPKIFIETTLKTGPKAELFFRDNKHKALITFMKDQTYCHNQTRGIMSCQGWSIIINRRQRDCRSLNSGEKLFT